MTTQAATNCPSCGEPLTERTKFCPACGRATPQSVNLNGPQAAPAPPPAEEGAEHRERLQRALGDGLKIRRLLGRGGFAEVWAAFDVRLKREVAVKTLRYDLVISDTLLQRFQREAEAVAKLRHPNIIPIYEVGEGDGLAYFVMPMIEGESLADALEREGSMSVEESTRILREAAGALAAAHRAGIVHRDVKPDNIMLEGPERRPIVMDFGIAKATTEGSAALTGTGMAMGTPHYMSPEQASGEKNVGPATDQYALALVGYRMLAGQPAFQADTMPTLIMKQIVEVPKPLDQIRPEVPHELSDALARALSKDPAARFPSMEEFSAAIPQVGASTATTGARRRRPSATELLKFPGGTMPSWRHPLSLVGMGAALIAIALFAPSRPRDALDLAAKRSDALFIGRAFLTKQGATGAYDERVTMERADTAIVWLQRSLPGGTAAADKRAMGMPVLQWHVTWDRTTPENIHETWEAGIAPNDSVVSFSRASTDSSPQPAISADSAKAFAVSFLTSAGRGMAGLTLSADSVEPRQNRIDHLFIWRVPAATIVGVRGDTMLASVRVRVAGAHVESYAYRYTPPHAFITAARESGWEGWAVTAIIIGWILMSVAAIVLAIRRQRSDDLQWTSALRIAVAGVLLTGAGLVINGQRIVNAGGSARVTIVALLFVGLVVVLGIALAVVSGESLANENNPRALVGLNSLARLRITAPDWPPAIVHGLAMAAIVVATDTLSRLSGAALAWRGPAAVDGLDLQQPWTLPLSKLGTGLLMTVLLFFAVHFLERLVKRAWLAVLLVAAAIGLMSVHPALRPWSVALEPAVAVALLTWTIWEFGFLAGFVAFWASEVFYSGESLLAVGNGPYLTAGMVCVASLLAVAASTFLPWRTKGI